MSGSTPLASPWSSTGWETYPWSAQTSRMELAQALDSEEDAYFELKASAPQKATQKSDEDAGSSTREHASGRCGQEHGLDDGLTTLMIRNIACRYKAADVRELLQQLGLVEYDFFYLPLSRRGRNSANFGYFFVNFTSAHAAQRCKMLLEGQSLGTTLKQCNVVPAAWQGIDELRQKFAKKAVMKNPERALFL